MTADIYIYLHGFASSPNSNKASYLRDRFAEANLELKVLDLNQGDFSKLTLTRQIEQTINAFPDPQTPVTLIGSSFGGLTCAWVAEQKLQVKRMILLAPAFGFPHSWYSKLQPEQIEQWRESGYLSVYHYGEKRSLRLHYEFLRDADNYPVSSLKRCSAVLGRRLLSGKLHADEASFVTQNAPWLSPMSDTALRRSAKSLRDVGANAPFKKRSLPTLIIHGLRDDVVPIEVSRNYVKQHPQAKLIELDSDHGLNDVKERIWQETKDFLELSSSKT